MKKAFLTGLAILVPVSVTLWVLLFLIHFFTDPFVGGVISLLDQIGIGVLPETVVRGIAQVAILVALVLLLWLIGVIAEWFFMGSLISLGESLLRRIPLVRTVYKTVKEITVTLFASSSTSFQQVVLLPFPNDDSYTLALVTKESPATCNEGAGDQLVSLFIPTTPNPTTGFLVMRPRKDLVHLEMKPDEAIKYIVSCGVALPETKR
jgi:uncharacterized membrane protein